MCVLRVYGAADANRARVRGRAQTTHTVPRAIVYFSRQHCVCYGSTGRVSAAPSLRRALKPYAQARPRPAARAGAQPRHTAGAWLQRRARAGRRLGDKAVLAGCCGS
eukprot:5066845-Prymnesium_polylepis.1